MLKVYDYNCENAFFFEVEPFSKGLKQNQKLRIRKIKRR